MSDLNTLRHGYCPNCGCYSILDTPGVSDLRSKHDYFFICIRCNSHWYADKDGKAGVLVELGLVGVWAEKCL